MIENIKNFIRSLPQLYNCCYISESPEEKLSGGFFYGTKLSDNIKKNKHNYFAFVYLINGTGSYTDYLECTYKLQPGSLFLRFPGKVYTIKMDDKNKWLEFAVAVPKSFYQSLSAAKIIDEKATFLQTQLSIKTLEAAIKFINSLEITGSPENTAHSYASLLNVFNILLNSPHQNFESNTRIKNLLEQAKLLLGSGLNKKISIPKEAAKLGLGYESFRKNFTLEYGLSPKAYRISRRLDKADVLLLHTDMSIKEIADSLGYPTDSDFIRQYKKHRNYPPNTFRKSRYLK